MHFANRLRITTAIIKSSPMTISPSALILSQLNFRRAHAPCHHPRFCLSSFPSFVAFDARR